MSNFGKTLLRLSPSLALFGCPADSPPSGSGGTTLASTGGPGGESSGAPAPGSSLSGIATEPTSSDASTGSESSSSSGGGTCLVGDDDFGDYGAVMFVYEPWPPKGIELDGLAVADCTHTPGEDAGDLTCTLADGSYGPFEVSIGASEPTARAMLEYISDLPETVVAFSGTNDPFLNHVFGVTVRSPSGDLLFAMFSNSAGAGDSFPSGTLDWADPFDPFTVEATQCAARPSGRTCTEEEFPTALTFEDDNGPVTVFDRSTAVALMDGTTFDVHVYRAFDRGELIGNDCWASEVNLALVRRLEE